MYLNIDKASFKENIQKYSFDNKPSEDIHSYFDSKIITEECKEASKLAINLAFEALTSESNNSEYISILNDFATDALLVPVIRKIINDDKKYKNAASYLSPLTERILKMKPILQDLVFEGNLNIDSINVYSEKQHRKYSDAQNDLYLNQNEFGLARLIHKIRIKAQSFDECQASQDANQLYKKLSELYLNYLNSSKDEDHYKQFKDNCANEISKVRKVLEKHRGWKNILANIMLHVGLLATTAGIGNLVAAGYAYYYQKSLFFTLTNTDTANHIKNIENFLNNRPS